MSNDKKGPAAKKKGLGIDTSTFKLDIAQKMPRRVADFLAWASKEHPGVLFTHAQIMQAVNGFAKPPKDSEVEAFWQSYAHQARLQLAKVYHKGVVAKRGIGLRATVDGLDAAETVVPAAARRLVAAKKGVDRAVGLVNVGLLPQTARGQKARDYIADLGTTVKSLTSERLDRLLLKAAGPGEENK